MPKPMPPHPLILVGDTPDVLARAIDDGVSVAACYKMNIPPRLKRKLRACYESMRKVAKRITPYPESDGFGISWVSVDDGRALFINIRKDRWNAFKTMALNTSSRTRHMIAHIEMLDGEIEQATGRKIIHRQFRMEGRGMPRRGGIHKDGSGLDSHRLLCVIDGATTDGFDDSSIIDNSNFRPPTIKNDDYFSFPDDSVVWLGDEKRGLWHRSPATWRHRFLYLPSLGPRG
jgi:hypothetical protein